MQRRDSRRESKNKTKKGRGKGGGLPHKNMDQIKEPSDKLSYLRGEWRRRARRAAT